MTIRKKIPIISIVGYSKTGKTTLIERLIPVLTGKGLKVAVVKHGIHGFKADTPGKDTYRLKKAGAKITILVSPRKIALTEDLDHEPDIKEIISRFVRNIDICIMEGFKNEKITKIEIFEQKGRKEGPLYENDNNIIALITDEPIIPPIPKFSRDDIAKVAEFIISTLSRK